MIAALAYALPFAAALLGAASLLSLCRAWWLFRHWAPAVALVQRADYVERQTAYGSGAGTAGFGPYQTGFRLVHETIRFEDVTGQRHEAAISRWLSRGDEPDAAFMIYYDPARPARLTPYGPLWWLAATAGIMLLLVPSLVLLAQGTLG